MPFDSIDREIKAGDVFALTAGEYSNYHTIGMYALRDIDLADECDIVGHRAKPETLAAHLVSAAAANRHCQ